MTRRSPAIAHLTTVDLSLRYLLWAQLEAPLEVGIESVGISAPGSWVPELEAAGIRHLSLPSSTRGVSLRGDLRAARDLYRHLRRLRPEILHTHNPKPGLYGRVVARLARVPIVVNTVHGLYAAPDDPAVKRTVVYGLEAVASRFSDAELVQSAEDADLIRRLRLAPPGHVVHLGNGVDLSRFDSRSLHPGVREEVRQELGVGTDQIVVGMVGRLVREKGYLELFRAAHLLDGRFTVVCVGPEDPDKPDALPPEEVERATRAGVRFLGMRTDVERLYAGMDVFVLPSHREGFPRAAMEAAAAGLPIVATDIRGCREVVEDGRNGFLVPVGDPEALADALARLADGAERERMAQEARQKAESDFDERRVVDTVMRTYLRLARRRGLDDLASALGRRERSGDATLRRAVHADAGFLAGMHMRAIPTGFLARLGPGFLRVLYRGLVEDPASVVLVAVDDSGLVGFVAGTGSTSGFYRRFLRRRGLQAAIAAAPRLLRPTAIRKAVESLRYGSGDGVTGPELLSMAVASDRRGAGIGTRLGRGFLEALGEDPVRVVVGSSNRGAISAYRRMGFLPASSIEVHSGEVSEVLEWSRR